jgi:hypothetical protein
MHTEAEFRDKAVLELAQVEDFLDLLETLGCRDVKVEALDEGEFLVSWISPPDSPPTQPLA